jgi:predicted ArsR family transcriptional regulator
VELRPAADLADLTPLSALGSPVRRRLYELVSAAGRAIGRDEAAAAVGVSRSLAAYHLDKLVERGLLEAGFSRQRDRGGPGAGRPAKLYLRASREFVLRAPPRDYRQLAEMLVRAVDEDRTGAGRAALERVAYKFGRSLGEESKRSAISDLNKLSDALRLRGYEPVEDERGTVRLRNCPFDTVAKQCPEVVCGLNLRLVEGLIEGLDLRHTRAALEPDERHCCVVIKGDRATPTLSKRD